MVEDNNMNTWTKLADKEPPLDTPLFIAICKNKEKCVCGPVYYHLSDYYENGQHILRKVFCTGRFEGSIYDEVPSHWMILLTPKHPEL